MFVYMIRHKTDNSVFYIGSTNDFHNRMTQHKSVCFNKKSNGYQFRIYKTIREHGWEMFDKFIIDVCVTDDRDVLEEMEKQYIIDLNPPLNMVDYTFDRKEYQRQYNAYYIREHAERERLRKLRYRTENHEKVRQSSRQYKIDNRDRLNADKRNKRAWATISKQFREIML